MIAICFKLLDKLTATVLVYWLVHWTLYLCDVYDD